MSKETAIWLNTQTLIGHTDKRGTAWHYREEAQGEETNHYAGAVPVEDVERRLFHWTANESPIFVGLPATLDTATGVNEHGDYITYEAMTDRKAITRSDTGAVLGVFKDGYKPHQPKEWLIENVQKLVGGSLDIGSAGLLKGGAVAWMQVEARDNWEVAGVEFRPSVLAATSFDGSLSSIYKTPMTIVVCDNTLELALGEAVPTMRIKHTRYSKFDAANVRDALGLIEQAAEAFVADVTTLTEWTITDKEWRLFLDEICKVNTEATTSRSKTLADTKRFDLTNLWLNDLRVAPWSNTAFGVLQATNTWNHHVQTVRGTNRAERNALNAITGATKKADADTLKVLAGVCGR